jgi:hypothetical protein
VMIFPIILNLARVPAHHRAQLGHPDDTPRGRGCPPAPLLLRANRETAPGTRPRWATPHPGHRPAQ